MGSLFKKEAGIICLQDGKVVLVSDDDGESWRIPSMKPEDDVSDAALKRLAEEAAWEEAGVLGHADDKRVGEFLHSEKGKMYQVSVFLIKAQKYRDKWPKSGELRRSLFSFEDAIVKVDEFGLRDIFEKLGRAPR